MVDRLHGAVPHVGGEAVRLHGAAGAPERGRHPDRATGARPHVGAPRERRGPARADAEALRKGRRGGEEEGGMARGPAGRKDGRAEAEVEGERDGGGGGHGGRRRGLGVRFRRRRRWWAFRGREGRRRVAVEGRAVEGGRVCSPWPRNRIWSKRPPGVRTRCWLRQSGGFGFFQKKNVVELFS